MSEELISLGDFKSVELSITVTNTTSRTKVGADKGIRLVEFTDAGIILEVPKATCAEGHHLTVEISRKDDPTWDTLSVTGKVDHLVRTSGGKPKDAGKTDEPKTQEEPDAFSAELTLVQYDENRWTAFQDLFSGRQAEIEKFLAAARGF